MNVLKVYCDEAGFTGTNLLDKDQPYFVYAGISISEEEAQKILKSIPERIKQRSKTEIKGKNLVQSTLGRSYLTQLFNDYGDKIRIVYDDKIYFLAGKIFDNIITLKLDKEEFYLKNFHQFIANFLYLGYKRKDPMAIQLFRWANDFMRGIAGPRSFRIDESSENLYLNWALSIINGLNNHKYLKPFKQKSSSLDQTAVSIIGILNDLGNHSNNLEVVYDETKAFKGNPVYDTLCKIGHTNFSLSRLGQEINFNLHGQIESGKSHDIPGLQIADFVVSSFYYALKNQRASFSKNIFNTFEKKCICKPNHNCVIPKLSQYHLQEMKKNEFNYYMFMEEISLH